NQNASNSLMPRCSARPGAPVQGGSETAAKRRERGREPEQNAGKDRNQKREPSDPGIDRERSRGGKNNRQIGHRQRGGESIDRGPERSADSREHNTFGEQLPEENSGSSAQRAPQREFPLARGGLREQKIRDVRATHRQHKSDRGPQRQQRRTSTAVEALLK